LPELFSPQICYYIPLYLQNKICVIETTAEKKNVEKQSIEVWKGNLSCRYQQNAKEKHKKQACRWKKKRT